MIVTIFRILNCLVRAACHVAAVVVVVVVVVIIVVVVEWCDVSS